MAVMISSDSVIRLFENNGFDYDDNRNLVIYSDTKPNIEFAIPWFVNDAGRTYDLAQVHAKLGEFMHYVAHTAAIRKKMSEPGFAESLTKELTEFGMQYVPSADNEQESDKFVYEENGSYLFGVDLDYIVSLLLINNGETVTSILTAMRDSEREKRYGKKTEN